MKKKLAIAMACIISLLAGYYFDVFDSVTTCVGEWHENHQRDRKLANWTREFQKVLNQMQNKQQKQEQICKESEKTLEETKALKCELAEKYRFYDGIMMDFMRMLEGLKPGEEFVFANGTYDKRRGESQRNRWAQELMLLREKIKIIDECIVEREKNVDEMHRDVQILQAQILDLQIKGDRVEAHKSSAKLASYNKLSCKEEMKEAEKLLQMLQADIDKPESQKIVVTTMVSMPPSSVDVISLDKMEKRLREHQNAGQPSEVDILIKEYRQRLNCNGQTSTSKQQ